MRFLIVIPLIMLLAAPAWGQQQYRIISVHEACDLAWQHNPDWKTYELQVEKKAAELKAAKSYRLPTVSGSFMGQRNHELATTPLPGELLGKPGEVVDTQFGQTYNYNAGLSVNKSLLDRSSRMSYKRAESDLTLQGAQQELYRQQLTEQVSAVYYAVLLAREAEQINARDVELADSMLLLSQQRKAAGLIADRSLNQSRIVANNARQNWYNSQASYADNSLQLRLLLGLDPETELLLEERLDDAAINNLQANMADDKELLVAAAQVDMATWSVKMRQAAYLPTLSLNSYFGQQQFRDDFGLSLNGDAWSGNSYTALSLNIPIFTGFSNKNKLKSAKIDQEIALYQQEAKQQQTSYADKMLLQNFEQSKRNATLSADNLGLYQSNSELSRQQYEQGLISLDEYLIAFEDMLKAQNAWLNAIGSVYNYYATIISRQP